MAVRYPRKRLDARAIDVARAAGRCCVAPSATESAQRLADLWPEPAEVLACLSVRTGLDLLLSCVDWPPGSEVLVSAVTIPHVPRLIREHGYVPVGVDVDPDTLTVAPADLEQACSPRTRAMLIAHLFGSNADMTAVAHLARRQHLMIIEDRAQSYDGRRQGLGLADVAMSSFGTIKTATCFGGAVLLVRDPRLRARMVEQHQTYPPQPTKAYLARLIKVAALLLISRPRWYPMITGLLQLVTGDYDRLVRRMSRGFRDVGLLRQLRHRPSPALLATMAVRLQAYDVSRVVQRGEVGDQLLGQLGPSVAVLGRTAPGSTHWLVAVTDPDPSGLVRAGRAAGFDLTTGSSTLVSVSDSCSRATVAMRDVVYLPVTTSLPRHAVRELAALVTAHAGRDGVAGTGVTPPVVGPAPQTHPLPTERA